MGEGVRNCRNRRIGMGCTGGGDVKCVCTEAGVVVVVGGGAVCMGGRRNRAKGVADL